MRLQSGPAATTNWPASAEPRGFLSTVTQEMGRKDGIGGRRLFQAVATEYNELSAR